MVFRHLKLLQKRQKSCQRNLLSRTQLLLKRKLLLRKSFSIFKASQKLQAKNKKLQLKRKLNFQFNQLKSLKLKQRLQKIWKLRLQLLLQLRKLSYKFNLRILLKLKHLQIHHKLSNRLLLWLSITTVKNLTMSGAMLNLKCLMIWSCLIHWRHMM